MPPPRTGQSIPELAGQRRREDIFPPTQKSTGYGGHTGAEGGVSSLPDLLGGSKEGWRKGWTAREAGVGGWTEEGEGGG